MFLSKPFNFRVILDYAPTSNAKEAEAGQFYEDLQDLELNRKKKKRCPWLHRVLECKSWKPKKKKKVGSQELPGVTGKFDLGEKNEAGQRLTEFYQENALVIASIIFQQHKRQLYTWTSPNDQF